MAALLFAALAASLAVAPVAGATTSGAAGVFTLPTATATADGQARVAFGFDWWRGGNFLLPAAQSQRTGGVLSASLGLGGGFVEAFGAISLRSTNLFSEASRRTLVSAGDVDLGVKLLVPGRGPFAAGVLLQLDAPSGVGGFSLAGTGGRAQLLFGYAGAAGPVPLSVSALMGYRLDNSARLVRGVPATLPAFALGLSSYDAVQAGASLQAPLRYGAPALELALESPVGRQRALPVGGRPLRARLAVGVAQLHSERLPQVGLTAALQLSLSRDGRIAELALPAPGFAPDPPWTVLAGLTWSFERPALPHRTRPIEWHEPSASAPPLPAAAARAVRAEKAVLRVVVLDAKTQLPLAGAWVSFVEGTDVGGTTGPEGKVRVEMEAGSGTMAVARDGYELLTEPIALRPGEEKQLTISLQEVAPDAVVRGKVLDEEGAPLRAAVFVSPSGTLPTLPKAPRIFEREYSFALQHGKYEVNAFAPGYRSTPMEVEARPGETVTRDLILGRIAGEPRARMGDQGLEFAAPIAFAPGVETLAPSSLPALAEVAAALKTELRALEVVARVELAEGLDDEARAVTLSEARARAVIVVLRANGVLVPLSPRGAGFARAGQPLLEIRLPPSMRAQLLRAAQPSLRGPP